MTVAAPPKLPDLLLSRFLVSYPAGAKIYREGDIGTEMFTIRSGAVEITQGSEGERRVLARLGKGDFFGEASVLDDVPREATAQALTDVELIRVNGAALEEMLRRDPEIAVRMMRKLSRQAREITSSLEEILGRRPLPRPQIAGGEADPAPSPGRVPAVPQLVSLDRKTRFTVHSDGDTIVGRADPLSATTPDVDLTPLDPERSVSRRHARLYPIGDILYVMEEIGAVNGTFVNNIKLATGAPAPLKHGDDLKLGFVTLTFWHPTA
jgi:CRP-like cAMP-binding protein